MVVPMLAPMMTPMACLSLSSPAFTKLTIITVVADELWIRQVVIKPVSTPLSRLLVMAPRMSPNVIRLLFECRRS